jgi:hypothetical protein
VVVGGACGVVVAGAVTVVVTVVAGVLGVVVPALVSVVFVEHAASENAAASAAVANKARVAGFAVIGCPRVCCCAAGRLHRGR